MASPTHRTQVSLPKTLYRRLRGALTLRAAKATVHGRPVPPTTLSGWVREQATKFIRSQT